MVEQKKSDIQKVVDMLEENGFYVLSAEQEGPSKYTLKYKNGTILLRISPKEDRKD